MSRLRDTFTRDLSPKTVAAVALAVLVVVAICWGVLRTRTRSTLSRRPPTAALGASGLERARQEYVDRLHGRAERDAFERGYDMGKTGAATWGTGSRNLGESGFAGAQRYTARQVEAFAMGIHFANEEAKLPGASHPDRAPGN